MTDKFTIKQIEAAFAKRTPGSGSGAFIALFPDELIAELTNGSGTMDIEPDQIDQMSEYGLQKELRKALNENIKLREECNSRIGTDELLNRLRDTTHIPYHIHTMEAADAIESLQARVASLETTLALEFLRNSVDFDYDHIVKQIKELAEKRRCSDR